MDIKSTEYSDFIGRIYNFHISDILDKVMSSQNELFSGVHDLKKSMNLNILDVNGFNATKKQEFLEDIFNQIFEYIISTSERNSIFQSYVDFCPEYKERYINDVEKLLYSEGIDIEKAPHYLNLQVRQSIFSACFFSLLCAFIEHTTRIESMTVSEFIYALQDKELNLEDADHIKISISKNRKRKRGLPSSYISDMDNLKQWRIRTLSKNINYKARGKWNALSTSAVRELSIVYSVVFSEKNTFNYNRWGSLNKLYSKIWEERNSTRDKCYTQRVNKACEKAIAKINSISFEDYLTQCKFFLNEIGKNIHFEGITLYKFETAHSLYNITTEVNSLLEVTTEYEINHILNCSNILKELHFPALYRSFCYIDDYDEMINCVQIFQMLQSDFVFASLLVLDELIVKNFFEDDWYPFLINIINEMAEKVLYSSDDIDFSLRPEAQECFRVILSEWVLANDIYE